MKELAQWSEVVAVGRLKEIREGRILGTARDDPGRTEHLVYVFDILEKPKGALPGDMAYVEAPKPSLEPATSFDAAAPKGAKAVLYLRFAPPTATDEQSVAPAPRPAGAPLLSFYHAARIPDRHRRSSRPSAATRRTLATHLRGR